MQCILQKVVVYKLLSNKIQMSILPENPMSKTNHRQIALLSKFSISRIDDVEETVSILVDQLLRISYEEGNSILNLIKSNIPENYPYKYQVIKPEEYGERFHELEKLTPRPDILHSKDIRRVEDTYMVHVESGSIAVMRHFNVTIEHQMAFHRFPFDRQLVRIEFRNYGIEYVSWPKNPKDPNEYWAAPNMWMKDKEWSQHETVATYHNEDWKVEGVDAYNCSDGPVQTRFITDIAVGRNASYYVNNCCLVIYVICLLACSVVACDLTDFGVRGSLTFTLLLTLVAFKFVINEFVPKISYLTLLDAYTAVGLLMLVAEIAENFVIVLYASADYETAYFIDIVFNIAYAVAWNAFHVFILVAYWCKFFEVKDLRAQRLSVIESTHTSKGSSGIPLRAAEKGGEPDHIHFH